MLSGSNGETSVTPYNVGAVFFGASVVWYLPFVLGPPAEFSPSFFFAVAFLLVGLPYISKAFLPAHDIFSLVETCTYAVASGAGFAFFGLSFGEEAGATTEVWILRACIVQGLQQIWVAALWFRGDNVSGRPARPWPLERSLLVGWIVFVVLASCGFVPLVHVPPIVRASWSVACLRTFENSLAKLTEQSTTASRHQRVPNFYDTLFRRRLVLWFLFSSALRDYWLSAVSLTWLSLPRWFLTLSSQSYGKNWPSCHREHLEGCRKIRTYGWFDAEFTPRFHLPSATRDAFTVGNEALNRLSEQARTDANRVRRGTSEDQDPPRTLESAQQLFGSLRFQD